MNCRHANPLQCTRANGDISSSRIVSFTKRVSCRCRKRSTVALMTQLAAAWATSWRLRRRGRSWRRRPDDRTPSAVVPASSRDVPSSRAAAAPRYSDTPRCTGCKVPPQTWTTAQNATSTNYPHARCWLDFVLPMQRRSSASTKATSYTRRTVVYTLGGFRFRIKPSIIHPVYDYCWTLYSVVLSRKIK